MTYFLDANIISYIIKNNPAVISRLQDLLRFGASIKIPVVAYYEVRRGLLAVNSTNRLSIFERQIKTFGIVQLTDKTFDMAAEIYADLKKDGMLIEDADLFIGCSAIENDAVLITNNAKHFHRIPRLQIEVLP